MNPETTECPICLMPAENQVVTTCNHVFHKNCLSHWLSQSADKSCPVCRTTQPNIEGEIITFWDNIYWVMKTYKYGNIERKFYSSGYLQYEFILSHNNKIIRSQILSRDGTVVYCHTEFSQEEINHLRDCGEIQLPVRTQVINYIYNDDILDSFENIFDNLYPPENI